MDSSRPDFVQLSPRDSVVVALKNLAAGTCIQLQHETLTLLDAVPAGHKIAIRNHRPDEPIFKFGWAIGLAANAIAAGQHVHTHNVRCDHQIDLNAIATEIPDPPESLAGYTFQGYRRPTGKVGTRNYLAVISNVNCSASVARMIARRFDAQALAAFPNVDGVLSFRHEAGCAMAFDGVRHRMLAQVLGGMAKHANIGGFLLVGLGCEQGTLDHLIQSQKLYQLNRPESANATDGNAVPVLSIQSTGGTRLTVERGVEIVARLLPQVNAAKRSIVPASELILGLQCGGSDGYSGITANPALGVTADLLVACGGTAILSETPEIYGAEHLLTRRARSRAVAEKLLERIEWWKWYCGNYGEAFDSNPSAGNKAGGLTTIAEKSLGAVAKGGSTALEAVYEYAEPIEHKGFVVMDGPGYDPANVTGLVASGANLVAFTTGRGSCFGFKPVPCYKIASNSSLFERMREDMDFNAGTVLEGQSVQAVGHELFVRLLATASGEKSCSEKLGIGDEEFVPWLVGPVL